MVDWTAPFEGNVIENVDCPDCGDECVLVREDSSADPREAVCLNCHALLEVEVFETFGEASLAYCAENGFEGAPVKASG